MSKLQAALRRWAWMLVTGAVVGAVIGGLSLAVRPERPPSYEATSVILFDLARSSSAAQQAAQQAGLRVTRGGVPLRAAQILGSDDPQALLSSLDVQVDGDSLSLTIRATDPDEGEAVAIADAFTSAFLELSNQQELDALDERIELLERQVAAAEDRLADFDADNPGVAGLTDTRIPLVQERSALVSELATLEQQLDETVQQRESTTGPYSPLGDPTVKPASATMLSLPSSPLTRVLLLSFLGLGLAALVIAMLERWNPRIDTKEEAQEATQLPVLATVPYLTRQARRRNATVDPEHFGGGYAESYRRVRSAIQFVSSRETPSNGSTAAARGQSFLVISASPGEGKTSTVAYTAFALAEADIPTLAINADCRRPTLHTRLSVAAEPGLTNLAEYVFERPSVDQVAQQGPIQGLWVVSSGHPGPLTTELVEATREVIDVATSRGATVVIDSSPLLATADAMELVPLVDHVIFVIRNGRTTRKEALEGLEMLRQRDAPMLGCLCIGAAGSRRRYAYYESYYYHSTATPAPTSPIASGWTTSAPAPDPTPRPPAEAPRPPTAAAPMPPHDAPPAGGPPRRPSTPPPYSPPQSTPVGGVRR